jgi:hypothetical protein
MKRSPFKPTGKPLQRKKAMARGTVELKSSKPMARGKSTLATTQPMRRTGKPMASVGQRAKRMRQGKIPPNAAEQAWMDKARAFGCVVCFLQTGLRTPAAIHHILSGGRRMGHLYTLPLCDPGHHQASPTPEKISRHPHKARFEAAYGSELDLLDTLKALLATDTISNHSLVDDIP